MAGPERKRVLDDISELGWPVFVKPARGGSSVGTSKASDMAGLERAIEVAREHDPKVLVETAIDGMEIECAVLEGTDGGPPEASVPGQVMVGGGAGFYDFEAKYLAAGTRHGHPGADSRRGHRGDQAAGRRGVRRDLLRGAGPRGLLLHAGRARSWSTRSTRCPG